jgi:hypothetical protein
MRTSKSKPWGFVFLFFVILAAFLFGGQELVGYRFPSTCFFYDYQIANEILFIRSSLLEMFIPEKLKLPMTKLKKAASQQLPFSKWHACKAELHVYRIRDK